ncbi:hypothetical protein HMPREF3230_00558 [Gardnerella vaginalis]|uniref:Uncharacterized protein n=1 Tax=Gardnerella vaginalis TaxID=2702 RepID=A0A135Z7Z6_GARVA|nr:hypothetical protein HMPREF3230_00558 [Gardnerella vaginalis]
MQQQFCSARAESSLIALCKVKLCCFCKRSVLQNGKASPTTSKTYVRKQQNLLYSKQNLTETN